jgi:hypothetical protein
MDILNKFLTDYIKIPSPNPPFTPRQVAARYRLVLLHRREQRRARIVISSIAMVAALFSFLFFNMNTRVLPDFFDPTLVRAATPFPTQTHTPPVSDRDRDPVITPAPWSD